MQEERVGGQTERCPEDYNPVMPWPYFRGMAEDSDAKTMDCSNSRYGNMDHCTMNLGALDVHLTPADLREIESVFLNNSARWPNEEQMRVGHSDGSSGRVAAVLRLCSVSELSGAGGGNGLSAIARSTYWPVTASMRGSTA